MMRLLTICNIVISIDSTNANVLTELGTFYNVLDEKSKALDFLKKAVKYDPKNYLL